jgi:hypothetical protein
MITGTRHTSFSEEEKKGCLHSYDGRNIEFGCDKIQADTYSHRLSNVAARVLS